MDDNPLCHDEEPKADHMLEDDSGGSAGAGNFDADAARRNFIDQVGGGGESGDTPEQEATREQTTLHDAGDVMTLSAQGLAEGQAGKISITLGSEDPDNPGSKTYELTYGDLRLLKPGEDEIVKKWRLVDPDATDDSPGKKRYLHDGVPFSVGRDPQARLRVDDSKVNVSRKHALLVTAGDSITFVHRGSNSSLVDAPKKAIVSVDRRSQEGITNGQST